MRTHRLQRYLFTFLFFYFLFIPFFVGAAIPSSERAALIALYNATSGDSWKDHSGWKKTPLYSDGFSMPGTEGSWNGVEVIDNHVYALALGDNNLAGTLPDELYTLSELNILSFTFNKLSGQIDPKLGQLKKLIHLALGVNELSGSIPVEICQLTGLTYLDLGNNQLTGNIPTLIGNLTKLTWLSLRDNQLTGPIPEGMGNLTRLTKLLLTSNKLSGPIPSSLGNLTRLIWMWLSYNELTGTIPKSLGNLSVLEDLDLCVNKLEGDIPVELYNLRNLRVFRLEYNHLTGTISPKIANLSLIEQIRLCWNHLEGTIPSEMGKLTRVKNVDLYSNKLKGPIPVQVMNMVGLDTQYGGFDIKENGLYTNSDAVRNFIAKYSPSPNWWQLHTVAPVDVTATALSTSSIQVAWTPYADSYHPDNYEIYFGTQSSGPWTYAGETGPYTFTYTKDGLLPGKTYYFAIKARKNPYLFNDNTVISDYSEVAAATTMLPAGTALLTVTSQPVTGVNVSVSPADYYGESNGVTGFSRLYTTGTTVTLSAPATVSGNEFLKWSVNGTESTVNSIQVVMTASLEAIAIYKDTTPPPPPSETVYTLTIESTHGDGAAISVSPTDENGDGDGSTTFTRQYKENTVVTLIAPTQHGSGVFDHWTVDGTKVTSSTTLELTVSGDHKVKAFYVTPSNPGLVVRPVKFNFGQIKGEAAPPGQTMRVTLNGSPLDWSATGNVDWLVLSPASGFGSTEVSVSLADTAANLNPGKYSGIITVDAPGADHSPQSVTVNLTVYDNDETVEPIGDFSTPLDGTTVYGSVAVTGWVVDDIGVESIKIYRQGKNQHDLIFIGDGVFVEGARPDVEELFPQYPQNYQAGWGYMLLTNFFPNQGNGTFILHAVATDIEGHQVTLGTKTITCDNTNAVKPFGAIDTPAQGGSADGNGFINWGWVLTPQPNWIPVDGSTIEVYVDGVKIGQPAYNIYRSDIASLFPDYTNSQGAIGYFYLDTTLYENGVHTIQWRAVDSGGNADGIGSRYFVIQNNSQSRSSGQLASQSAIADKTGSGPNLCYGDIVGLPLAIDGLPVTAEESQDMRLCLKEPAPLQLPLSRWGNVVAGYSLVGEELRPLPIGSTLNRDNGIFSWQPGPGFLGTYRLVFIFEQYGDGVRLVKKEFRIAIQPQ